MLEILMINFLFQMEKKLFLACFFCFGVLCIGVVKEFHQLKKYKKVKKDYQKNKLLLNHYMMNVKDAPSDKIIDILNQEKDSLLKKKKMINENNFFHKHSEDPFPKIKTVLQFREMLTEKRKKSSIKDIGFSEYRNTIPLFSKLRELKKEFYLIEKMINLSYQNHINKWIRIVRLGLKKERDSLPFQKYGVLFAFHSSSKNLMSFLYDIVQLKEPMIIEAIRIESLRKKSLFVILKISLLEKIDS